MGKNFLLTEEQKQWMDTKLRTLNARPRLAMIRPKTNKFRQFCFDIAVSKTFESFILVIIFLNTISMAFKWLGMSGSEERFVETINYFFTGIFVLEAAVKLIAFEGRYFKDSWNVFDFFIVASSVVFIALKELFRVNLGSTT